MTRETENAVVLLIGLCTAIITITGSYMRYVKPTLLPWLAVSAALLIALALVSIVRDIRRGSAYSPHGDGHAHRSGVVWLLVVPIVLLGFVVPPAITGGAATPSAAVSNEAPRRAFPPLPDERAPTLALPEVLVRIARASGNTLDDRLITVTGFTYKADGRTDLARVVIICCAADATLARIRLSGPTATQIASYPDNTWITVEAKIPAGQKISGVRDIPTMDVFSATRIEPPANPYAY